MSRKLSDHEVERALGYSPCVCGVLDGTWHSDCYRARTPAQVRAAYKPNIQKAREHLAALKLARQPASE